MSTLTPHPLSVDDGIVGAEENTPAEDEAQHKAAAQATDAQKAFALEMYDYANEAIDRALGTAAPLQESFDPEQPRFPKGHPQAGQWRPKLATGGELGGMLEDAVKPIVAQIDAWAKETDSQGTPGWVGLVDHEHLQQLGHQIDSIAQRHSTLPAYSRRRLKLEDEWAALDEERYRANQELDSFLIDPASKGLMMSDWTDKEGRNINAPGWAADRTALLGKIDEMGKQLVAKQTEITQLRRSEQRATQDAIIGVLSKIRPMGGKLDAQYLGKISNADKLTAEKQVREAQRMIPSAWIDDMNRSGTARFQLSTGPVRADHRDVPRYIDHSDDAAYKHFVNPNGSIDYDAAEAKSQELINEYGPTMREEVGTDSVIRVSTTTPTRTFLHEIMHRVQYVASSLTVGGKPAVSPTAAVRHRAEYNLLTKRGGPQSGSTPADVAKLTKKLADIYPNSGYEDYEVAIPDEWADAYYGKVYRHYSEPANELLTMATEDTFYDPVKLRLKDPLTLDWLIGLMAAT